MNFVVITWEQLEKDCIALAKKIAASGQKFDEIISVSRGGMVVSRMLSDLLNLPVSHIALASYEGLHQEQEPRVTQKSSRLFNGESVLLVDELADSGKTFVAALDYLHTLPLGDILTAAPYIKPQTSYIPNFFIKNHDGWIILPYELRETKESFMKEFGKEKGLEKLSQLGIHDWEE